MQTYESIVLVRSQLSDAEIGDVLEKMKKVLLQGGGEILGEERWGRRKFTHPVKKQREGFYLYLRYKSNPGALNQLDYHFKVSDSILRSVTVRSDRKDQSDRKNGVKEA